MMHAVWRSLRLPFIQRFVTVGGRAPPYGFSVAVSGAFGREEAPCALRAVVGGYEAPCLTSCRGRPRQKDEAGDKDNALPRDETLQERARLSRLQKSRRHLRLTMGVPPSFASRRLTMRALSWKVEQLWK